MRQPNVSANDAVMAYARFSSDDGSSRVDGDVIFDIWMPLVGKTAQYLTVFVSTTKRVERSQCDPVVYRYLLSDGCRLPITTPVPWSMKNESSMVAPE